MSNTEEKGKFSAILNATDLNDFITPSQACIKPFITNETANFSEDREIKIQYEDMNSKDQEIKRTPLKSSNERQKAAPVNITLTDCLACSGCITSAETILISQQKPRELYDILSLNTSSVMSEKTFMVASLSNQILASFAAKYNTTCNNMASKIVKFLKTIGIHYVFDMGFAGDLSLILSWREFHQLSSTKNALTTMVSSACPGWICYAEKVHPYMLPYISHVKSPQQITGSLLKHVIIKDLPSYQPSMRMYHVAIMSCYDKKLEASRNDFYDDILKTTDVDCVLTSGELEAMMLEHYGTGFISFINDDCGSPFDTNLFSPCQLYIPSKEESGSGGFARYILNRTLAHVQSQAHSDDSYLINCSDKGQDYKEYTVQDLIQGTVFKFILCYGFKNIQNLLRRIKQSASATQAEQCKRVYTFVEIMACPSGCLNGGGQLLSAPWHSDGIPISARELLKRTQDVYQDTLKIQSPEQNYIIMQDQLEKWFGEDFWKSDLFHKCVNTEYHSIEKTLSRTPTQW